MITVSAAMLDRSASELEERMEAIRTGDNSSCQNTNERQKIQAIVAPNIERKAQLSRESFNVEVEECILKFVVATRITSHLPSSP